MGVSKKAKTGGEGSSEAWAEQKKQIEPLLKQLTDLQQEMDRKVTARWCCVRGSGLTCELSCVRADSSGNGCA